MYIILLLLILFSCPLLVIPLVKASLLTTAGFLRDPGTIISSNSIFEAGFFSPPNSSNRYFGIWYNIPDSEVLEVIWVANRNNPLTDTSGVFKISEEGNLQLLDGKNQSYWSSSNITRNLEANYSKVAQILDTGNLVLLTNASDTTIWQSFEHPTNSLLPPVQFTVHDGLTDEPILQSWRTTSDPSTGRFKASINKRNLTEIFIWKDETIPYWRSGPWNGNIIVGIVPYMTTISLNGFSLSEGNRNSFYISYSFPNGSSKEHVMLDSNGSFLTKIFDASRKEWKIEWMSKHSECDVFGKCGPFGSCNPRENPICGCIRGFEPKNSEEWKNGNWTNGCVRRTPLQCGVLGGKRDGFLRLKNRKVPDNAKWISVQDETDCRMKCLNKCSCLAYADYSGIGCMIWNESLIDIQEFPFPSVDLYIRLVGDAK